MAPAPLGAIFGASPCRVISRSDRGDLITALARTRSRSITWQMRAKFST